MSSYTCITCRVAFNDGEIQRAHYKTDWHRYNLKRKVAELPPVSAENFKDRVLAQRAQAADENKSTATRCHLCCKNFNTENAFQNHLQSKKHKEAEQKEKIRMEKEVLKKNEKNENYDVLEENERPSLKDAKNNALKNSMALAGTSSGHATSTSHKPQSANLQEDDEEMDSDGESCESWEGEALGLEECLFCSYVSQSLEKNVNHMTKEHSFFIPDAEYLTDLEGLITYLGEKIGEGNVCLWCNEKGKSFHSTQAVQRHMVDKGHCKMLHDGEVLVEYADFYDYRPSYPDFQTADTDEDMELTEEEAQASYLTDAGYELVLPSGAAVGHRSLRRYFKQNLPQKRQSNPSLMNKMMAQYKALGWVGVKGDGAQRRAKDMAYVQRLRLRQNLRMSLKSNKFQFHYRDDNFGIRH